jgi:hypothetical protein
MNDAFQTRRPMIICKDLCTPSARPNFTDYECERAAFSWTATCDAVLQALSPELPSDVPHELLRIDISDPDHAEIQTLDAVVAYLGQRLSS